MWISNALNGLFIIVERERLDETAENVDYWTPKILAAQIRQSSILFSTNSVDFK